MTNSLPDSIGKGLHHGPRLFFRFRPGGHPDKHLVILGIGGGGGVSALHQVINQLCHGTLAHSEHMKVFRDNHRVFPGGQTGDGIPDQHGRQLRRRPGQHHHDFPRFRFKNAAGGCAHIIGQHRAAFGEPRLFFLAFTPQTALEVLLNPPQAFLMEYQLFPGSSGNGLLGQVIPGRPQPSGSDQNIAAGQSGFHRFLQPSGIIPHGGAVQHVHPDGGQLPGHNGGIGIHRVAQQQLGTHGENFCIHEQGFLSIIRPLFSGASQCGYTTRSASTLPAALPHPALLPLLPQYAEWGECGDVWG